MLLTSASVVFTLKRRQKTGREHKDEPKSCSSKLMCVQVSQGWMKNKNGRRQHSSMSSRASGQKGWPQKTRKDISRCQQIQQFFPQCPLSLLPLPVSPEKFGGAVQGWKWGSWVQLLLEHWNPSPITQYLGTKICSCETHSWILERTSKKRKSESNPTPENGSCINREKWEVLSLTLDWAAGLDLALCWALCWLWGILSPDFTPQYEPVLPSFNGLGPGNLNQNRFAVNRENPVLTELGWMVYLTPRKSIQSERLPRKHLQNTKAFVGRTGYQYSRN